MASGTSRHAGMAGQYMIQDLVNIPVDVDYASEFEYRNPLIGPGELTIVITQSGETADTTAAQREAKAKGSRTIAISNVVDSTIAREADGVLYTHAGPEISIASTKAFTAQMAVLYLFALYLGQVRASFPKSSGENTFESCSICPEKLETLLKSAPAACERLADKFYKVEDFLFMGRAIHYPVAMDGALKLKEVSYIHAEGYPTGETKHGPNAMIDENLPVVIIATCDRNDSGSVLRHEKNLANIRGFKQQSARVIAIASEGDEELLQLCRPHNFCSASAGIAAANSGDRAFAAVRLLHDREKGFGCGSAEKPGEVGDFGIRRTGHGVLRLRHARWRQVLSASQGDLRPPKLFNQNHRKTI